MHTSYGSGVNRRKKCIAIALRRVRSGSGSPEAFLRRKTLANPIIDLRRFIKKVPFLVIGGFATRLYMPERMTLDLDILVRIEDVSEAEQELIRRGCQKVGPLAIGGTTWILPEKTTLAVVIIDEAWVKEAVEHPRIASDGLTYIDLPYLALMKLQSSRVQDIADISRMVGCADEKALQKTRDIIQRYHPEDLEDLESLILLGQLEMAK